MSEITAEDLREQIRQYLNTHESKDDWGVIYIYTKGLRELLGIEASTFNYSWERTQDA